MPGAREAREAMAARWRARVSRERGLFGSAALDGRSPPSVFVGSAGYPLVRAGPGVSPAGAGAAGLDSPEGWAGLGLGEIVSRRMGLVRATMRVRADRPAGRYVESLQEVAMSAAPADAEIELEGPPAPPPPPDGRCAPFGPSGSIRRASLSAGPALRPLERAYYDRDLAAAEAVVSLHGAGVPVSAIQRCLSAGMLGRRRRLVPTRWAVTAADDCIASGLVSGLLGAPASDSHRVYHHRILDNAYSVVLFPGPWRFEMVEAWRSGGSLCFGSDSEGPRGLGRPPSIAGAYHAARLAVAEHLAREGAQAGALVLREIGPGYSVPVGVWQVREGVRAALRGAPAWAGSAGEALDAACRLTGVPRGEWEAHSGIRASLAQTRITGY